MVDNNKTQTVSQYFSAYRPQPKYAVIKQAFHAATHTNVCRPFTGY